MREPDFELSADMRLLELQRSALGLPPRERLAWESHGAESSIPVAQAEPEPGRSAVLAVEASAFPADGVIAGAVVTLAMSVGNEGAVLATDVVATAPLPGGAAYRPGTFVWNGRSTYDEVAENFFNQGLAIGALDVGERATFQWKVGVRLGTRPLVVAPQVRSSNAAIVGAKPLVVGRKPQTAGAFGGELEQAGAALYDAKPLIPVEIPATELPIYELDEEEQLVYEATEAAISLAAKPQRTPEPKAIVEPEPVPAVEPEPVVAVEPEPVAPEPVPLRQAVVLYGSFDRATIAFFERTFGGTKPPTILQHCIFGGALACALDARGQDRAQLKAHLDAQSGILHRIVLHEKLGKKEPIAEYAGSLIAQLDRLMPEPLENPSQSASKDRLVLVAELSDPTRTVLQRISEERARWDFVKARQLTLALQAQGVATDLDPALRERTKNALHVYAQASVMVLQKLFVRIRIDRTTGLLFQTEPALDAAARAVVAAFKAALG
jgi:uncharacterized repeat protein (TIGR01451 family)